MTKVLNQFPQLEPQGAARIAIIGECASRDDIHQGVPFSGEVGRMLEGALGHVGIARASCWVGNVCQALPPGGSFSALDWNGSEVQDGIQQLGVDLERFRPSIVLCMGSAALHLLKHGNIPPRKTKLGFDWPSKIGGWRGSLFTSDFLSSSSVSSDEVSDLGGAESRLPDPLTCPETERRGANPRMSKPLKCLATLHPSAVLRDYGLQAYWRTGVGGLGDMERLREEMGTSELVLTQRDIRVCTDDPVQLDSYVRTWRFAKCPVAVDIEGGPGNVTSIAFALKPDVAVVVPFAHVDGTSVWSERDETILWQAVKNLLEDPLVPKVAMHGTYDFFALAWTYGIVVRNWHDIEVSWWELFAELKKSLATQVSLLTREPFYKPDKEEGELKFESDEQFWSYNGLDAACTIECWQRHQEMMDARQKAHYEFNRSLFPAVLYMMLRGIKFDKAKAKAAGREAERGAMELQYKIDSEASIQGPPNNQWIAMCDAVSEGEEESFAQLVLRCLAGKNPRVKVEVVEERWQPMRWSGRKWVKDGKLMPGPLTPLGEVQVPEPEKPEKGAPWFVPKHKITAKLQPFAPVCLSDCEPHILESKKGEWKRVKAIWKEIKANAQQTGNTNSASDLRGACGTEQREILARYSGKESGPDQRTALLGELSTLLGLAVNIGSTSQGGDAQRFLYETCGLRRVYKDQWTGRLSWEAEGEWRKRVSSGRAAVRAGVAEVSEQGVSDTGGSDQDGAGRVEATVTETRETALASGSDEPQAKRSAPAGKRLSTDQQALDKLYAATQDVRVLWCLQQRRLRLAAVNLAKEIDDDGRIRSSISLVKETGRMAASESPTGTGTNLQSWDRDHRSVCVADEGCVMGQCDLEGADSWTVAAECAALGDRKMLEDLKGPQGFVGTFLKPAKGLCFGYFEPDNYARAAASEIKTRLRDLVQPDWLYAGAKAATHGSSYGMGWKTMIDNVLKFSMADLPLDLASAKPVVLTKAQVEKLQGAFLRRYPGVKLWHAKTEKLLLTTGVLEMSTGHRRRIYQRKAEFKQGRKVACWETVKEILSSAPQYYTTYAIKLALAKLWNDPANRRGEELRVEPLLCVHDSILTQWKAEDGGFARPLMREIFQNEIEIAGQKIVIPAEGFVYSDWSMDKEKAERL